MQPEQRHLVLLRHAKSEWPYGVRDLRRPLAKRGRRDAVAVGGWIRDHVPPLDAVICSPAERARRTWALVAAELDDPPPARYDERVYGAVATELLTLVRKLSNNVGAALLVGHNPDLEELAALLSGQDVEMKTSSLAVLAWRGRWADLAAGTVELRHHATPRG